MGSGGLLTLPVSKIRLISEGFVPRTGSVEPRVVQFLREREVLPLTRGVMEKCKCVKDAPGGAACVVRIAEKGDVVGSTWAAVVAMQDFYGRIVF